VTDKPAVWIDGELFDAADATISPFDHSVTVGDGVFETLKIVDGIAFALGRHLERLRRSADGLGLQVPIDDQQLRTAVAATIAANRLQSGRVRVTVTGGVGPLGSDRGDGTASVIVAATAQDPRPPSAVVVTVPWRRNEHSAVAGLKTTSYADNVVALRRARELDADEALFANTAGNLCEGTGTNVFVGLEGRLITPPLSAGCLAGTIRGLLVESLPAIEQIDIPIGRLVDADEAFLTSSTREIQPVATIDGRRLPQCPGPLTQQAHDVFEAIKARSLDP
jgi:branched-chain amino acid aminotransferase